MVYIGNIIELVSGRDLTLHDISSVPSGFPYLTGASQITPEEIIINRWTTNPAVISQLNDILLTCKGTVGKIIINNIGEIHIARQIMALRNRSVCIHNKYLKLFLEDVVSYLISKANGLIPGISREDILYLKFPLPPLAEQKRIVAKIESYLTVINKAEALIDKKANLDEEIRNKILDLAIRGKLVEQRPEEGTAEELYTQIQEEKQKLIAEGKIKKEKPLQEISEDEIPFEIPESWKWVKLGKIASIYGGKRIPAGRSLTDDNTGHYYIRVSDMKDGSVIKDNLLFVPEDIYPSISRYIINKEDIYITVAGTIGDVGKIPPELNGANLTENADRIVFKNIEQDWFINILNSSLIKSQIAEFTTKVGQPKLAIMRIQNLFIPLPPLAEQKRIVAKIEELLPYCEKLK